MAEEFLEMPHDFCKAGCAHAGLSVETKIVYANGEPYAVSREIKCAHEEACKAQRAIHSEPVKHFVSICPNCGIGVLTDNPVPRF